MQILMAGTGSGGARNFKRTVLNPVDLDQYAESLTADERQLLARLHRRFASVWGVPIPQRHRVPSVTDLAPGDQAWFHHEGFVHHVAIVMTVFHNLDFDRALWDELEFPASGFVFTLARPQAARIAKAEVNRLVGYKPRYTWQENVLINEEISHRLADATELVTAD